MRTSKTAIPNTGKKRSGDTLIPPTKKCDTKRDFSSERSAGSTIFFAASKLPLLAPSGLPPLSTASLPSGITQAASQKAPDTLLQSAQAVRPEAGQPIATQQPTAIPSAVAPAAPLPIPPKNQVVAQTVTKQRSDAPNAYRWRIDQFLNAIRTTQNQIATFPDLHTTKLKKDIFSALPHFEEDITEQLPASKKGALNIDIYPQDIVLAPTGQKARFAIKLSPKYFSPNSADRPNGAIDMVIAVDHSGSMGWIDPGESKAKISYLRQVFRRILRSENAAFFEKDRISLVTFNNVSSHQHNGLTFATPANKEKLIEIVNDLTPSAGTPLMDATEHALKILTHRKTGKTDLNRLSRIMLITDGQEESSRNTTANKDAFLKTLQEQKIPVDVYCIGSSVDLEFCREIANKTNGNLILIRNAAQIEQEVTDGISRTFETFSPVSFAMTSSQLPTSAIKIFRIKGEQEFSPNQQYLLENIVNGVDEHLVVEIDTSGLPVEQTFTINMNIDGQESALSLQTTPPQATAAPVPPQVALALLMFKFYMVKDENDLAALKKALEQLKPAFGEDSKDIEKLLSDITQEEKKIQAEQERIRRLASIGSATRGVSASQFFTSAAPSLSSAPATSRSAHISQLPSPYLP
ncbi:MAG: von Willebrand factor protein [Gammaproteobacteria bacterium]|jgi:Mg-chelatase subunit ChlD|nr:von Willebrand factor protein [Gammaproteobacteria bacterium]